MPIFSQTDNINENKAVQNDGLIQNEAVEDTTINKELNNEAKIANAIEPTAGNSLSIPEKVEKNQEIVSSGTLKATTIIDADLEGINAQGGLNKTKLEYDTRSSSYSTKTDTSPVLNVILNKAKTTTKYIFETEGEDTDTETHTDTTICVVPEFKALLSNATYKENYINNTNSYGLELEKFGNLNKFNGDEMDIKGVDGDALVYARHTHKHGLRVVLKSEWNTIKNIELYSENLDKATLKNFVHTDVKLSGVEDKHLRIIDTKRGFIRTDEGDDVIFVKAMTNGAGWSNTFDIDSGSGDDSVTVRGHSGYTISMVKTGDGNDLVKMLGDYDHSKTELGSGDDIFKGGKSKDIVHGGNGNDTIRGNKGSDILYGDGINQTTIYVSGRHLNIEFVKSQAGYHNTVGYYTVDAKGNITHTDIAFESLKLFSTGDSTDIKIENAQEDVHLFIIADGYRKNGKFEDIDLTIGTVDFVFGYGTKEERGATIHDKAEAVSLVYKNGDKEMVLEGNIYHQTDSLNMDGADHDLVTELDDGREQYAFEDLFNLGDRDYTDAVVNVKDTLIYDTKYSDTGSNDDVINGGKDNDILVGGSGNDTLKGGQGHDIAVLRGTIDEYDITKINNNTYEITDTVDGRDGVDIVKGIESILFGVDEFYLDIVLNWSEKEIYRKFGVSESQDIDLSHLIESYDSLQKSMDEFVHVKCSHNKMDINDNDYGFMLIDTTEAFEVNNVDTVL